MKFSRPFLKSLQAPFEGKNAGEVIFLPIIVLILVENTTYYHRKNFTLKLSLKRYLSGFQKKNACLHLLIFLGIY